MPKLTRSPGLIATFAASIAFVAALFAPWQETNGMSYSGFSGWGVAAFIFAAFVALEAGMQLNGVVKRIPVPPPVLLLVPALLCLIVTIVKFLVDGDGREIWAWIGLALAVALLIASYFNARELLRMLRQMRTAMAAAKSGAAAAQRPAAKKQPAAKKVAAKSGGASCDGVWNIAMDTPMGSQKITLTLVSSGSELSGTADTPFGVQEFDGGTVDGDDISWQVALTQPAPMTLTFKAKIKGGKLDGIVELPGMGESSFDGTRA